MLEEDLLDAMGLDVVAPLRGTPCSDSADEWKLELNGLEVLVPNDFNTTVDAEGNTLIYPKRYDCPPSGRMPWAFSLTALSARIRSTKRS